MNLTMLAKNFMLRTGNGLLPLIQRNRKVMGLASQLNGWMTAKAEARLLRSFEEARPSRGIKGLYGINAAGYLTSESGVGESARAEVSAIKRAGIPCALNNVGSLSRQNDSTFTDITAENPYVFNLMHVNADVLPDFLAGRGLGYFKDRYNIGYWFWELEEFPEVWKKRFLFLDELWVATEFCREAMARKSPIPVVKVPLAVELAVKDVKRSRFGIPEGAYVFTFAFDFMSFYERKNPLAVVRAFREAFAGKNTKDADALLVLKCSNSRWNTSARDEMVRESRGLNVMLIDEYLDKDDLKGLMALSDCYVSLHRSEGFGLPLAEAMYLGKPVIATGYSGNMEFMDRENSFPVKYRLVEIEKDFGPYKKGCHWAEPDVSHAAELMRFVHENREKAAAVGAKASGDIRARHNPEAVGKKIRERLDAILKEKGGSIKLTGGDR